MKANEGNVGLRRAERSGLVCVVAGLFADDYCLQSARNLQRKVDDF